MKIFTYQRFNTIFTDEGDFFLNIIFFKRDHLFIYPFLPSSNSFNYNSQSVVAVNNISSVFIMLLM